MPLFILLHDDDENESENMKNLNVTISEEADNLLDRIMAQKAFKNRADAVDWIIKTIFEKLFGGE